MEDGIARRVRELLGRDGVNLAMAACRKMGSLALRAPAIGSCYGMRKHARNMCQGLSFIENMPNS